MANPSPDRREALSLLARIATLSQFPGFSRWVCGAESLNQEASPTRPASYQPLFFSRAEYNTVDMLAEQIIPKDSTAGAHEAGVAEFIDFMVSHDAELQYPFRTGLAWLDAYPPRRQVRNFPLLHWPIAKNCLARSPIGQSNPRRRSRVKSSSH